MNRCDIYVGVVKKCLDVKNYKKYGENYFIKEFKTKSMTIGQELPTVSVYNDEAILIKTSNGYVDIYNVDGLFAEKRIEKNKCIMPIEPSYDGQLFVDESSLLPYYLDKTNKKIHVKKIKKDLYLDSRIKGGIEH